MGRSARKREFSVVVRYGRLYEDRLPTSYGQGEPNLDDFVVIGQEDGYLVLSPKPYKGLVLQYNNQLSLSAKSRLSKINPRKFYITISIWDDSYEEFQLLRKYLVENKYNYRLLVLTDRDEVIETSVPNPKVQ